MDEKRTEIEKQHQKRLRPLTWITIPVDLAAMFLTAYGARLRNEGGSGLLMFAGFLILIAVSAAWVIVTRRSARLRDEALAALEKEIEANPDLNEEDFLLPGEGGASSLLVMGYPSDTVYQLVSGPQEYHFVKLGWGGLSADSFERMIPPGLSDEEIRAQTKKGFSVPKTDVESLEITMKQCISTQLPNDGIFTLRTGGKKRKYILLRPNEPATPEALRTFFADVSGRLTMDSARYEKAEAIRQEIRELSDDPDERPDPAVVKKLRPLAIVLCVLPWLCYAVWRFLDVPYRPMAALQVILSLLPSVMAIALPRYCSLNSVTKLNRHDPDEARPGTIDMFYPIVIALLPVMLGAMADFNIRGFIPLVIETAVFSVILTLLFTRKPAGIRKVWVVRLLLVLILMVFSSGIILESNYLLDRSEPEAVRLPVADKHISSGRSTSYVLSFTENGEEFSLDVEPELYDRVQPGDSVYVVSSKGGLGIEYATVWTVDEWNNRY